jgi:hypothetical protein
MAARDSAAFVAAASAAAASAAAASAAAASADAAAAADERETLKVSLSQLTLSVRLCNYAECRKPLHRVLQCAKCKGIAYCSKDCQVCSPPHPACALSRPQTYPSAPLLLTRVIVTCRSLCTLPLSLKLAPSHCSLTPYTHSSFTPSLTHTRTNPPMVAFQTRRGRPDTSAGAH